MFSRSIKLVLAVALVASMFLPGAQIAYADSQAQSSPEKPLAYTNAWVTIQPGEWQWYAFKYNFDADNSDKIVPATIHLYSQPQNGVTLSLINRDQVQAWEHGEALETFGAATQVFDQTKVSQGIARFCRNNPNDPVCTNGNGTGNIAGTRCENGPMPGDVTARCHFTVATPLGYSNWSGVIGSTGTYYILVRRAAQASGPAQYRFTISGDGVTIK